MLAVMSTGGKRRERLQRKPGEVYTVVETLFFASIILTIVLFQTSHRKTLTSPKICNFTIRSNLLVSEKLLDKLVDVFCLFCSSFVSTFSCFLSEIN